MIVILDLIHIYGPIKEYQLEIEYWLVPIAVFLITNPINAETRHRQFLEIVSTAQPEWVTLNDKEIVIEDDAWIGTNVVILKGVRIGKGAIIGAGSVVTHDIPPYAIAHGNPAKISRVVENFT